MRSPITAIINHLSTTTVGATVSAGIGYMFCSRVLKQIDPKVGLACGATAGVICGLFATEESNAASKAIAIAALLFIPFAVCEKLELSAPLKAVRIITGVTAVTCLALNYLFSDSGYKNL